LENESGPYETGTSHVAWWTGTDL